MAQMNWSVRAATSSNFRLISDKVAVPSRYLLGHVDVAEAQATRVAVNDVSHQEVACLAIEPAFDLEVDVDAAVLLPRLLDDLERRDREAPQARDELRRDVGVSALFERFFGDQVAGLGVRADRLCRLLVGHVPPQNAGFEVEVQQRVVVCIVLLEDLEHELVEDGAVWQVGEAVSNAAGGVPACDELQRDQFQRCVLGR